MRQTDPYAAFADPVARPASPQVRPQNNRADPYAAFAAPVAAPQTASAQRPAAAPQALPMAPQAPSAAPQGLGREERIGALLDQGFPPDVVEQMADEQMALEGMAPTGPAVAQPQAQPVSNYDIPEGVIDYETLTPEALNQLPRGTRILMPPNAAGEYRRIETLARDMSAPQREPILGERQETIGGVRTYVPGMADTVAGFASGALEQIPGGDEGLNLVDALMSRRSFSESRDEYQLMQEALNGSNGLARDVGGVTGFLGSMALPGSIGLKGLQGVTGVGRTAAAAIGAAPLGAAYGFASGEGGAAERAPGAVLGGLLGGGAAGVLDAGARAAPNIASGLSEAGAVISRGFGREAPEATITPRATQSAQEYVTRLLRSSGAELTGNPVAAMDMGMTAAEAIGPSGVSNMAALSRRAGRAGNMARDQLGKRAGEQQQAVVQDFADLTGMDPAGSADMVDNIVATGRQRAAPLWAAVDELQVTPTPAMEDILRRPSGRAALRRAYRIARDEGVNPESLGLFVMEAGDGGLRTGASAIARDADTLADLDALRAGRSVSGAGRGPSLIDFISRNGGVRDDGGELAQIGATSWNRQGFWRSQAVKETGLDLETMAQRALDAGYFDDLGGVAGEVDNYQRLGAQDLINAIDDELRGTPRYGRAEGDTDRSAAAVMRRQRRAALDERLQREGVDINTASNEEILRHIRDADDADARVMAQLYGEGPDAPQIEFVPGVVPSVRTLDYVRRGMNQVLEGARDKTTRRLNLDDETRPIVANVSRFRDELIAATGGEQGPYARALAESGDYLRVEAAFRQSERLFATGTSERAFRQATERMGAAERNALVAGFADRLFTDSRSNSLGTRRMGQINTPANREKLASLIGPEQADAFMQRLTARVDLARTGGRMAPGTNSTTGEVTEAMRDQDQGVGLGADFARALATSRGDVVSATLSTAGKAIAAPIAGFVRGATAPAAQPVRDEIARLLLMPPDDLAAILSRSGDLSRREATDLASALQRAAPDAPQAGQDEFAFPPLAVPPARRGGRQ